MQKYLTNYNNDDESIEIENNINSKGDYNIFGRGL